MYNRHAKMAILACSLLLMTAAAGCGQETTDTIEETVSVAQTETTESTTEELTQETEATEAQVQEKAELTAEDFQIVIGETAIEIGGDMIAYQEIIGEPDDYSAAKSCLGSGEDKTFIYGETAIYTKPIDDMDKIYLIEVTGGAKLPCGIGVGSSLEEVEAVFGACEDIEGTEYLYTLEDKTIGFDMDKNVVSFIEIFGEEQE